MLQEEQRRFLQAALQEALQAERQGEDPVGCVIVNAVGRIIAYGHNHINQLNDPTAHAEMLAIRAAIPEMQGESARGWTLYTTLEPCPMCLGTIVMCEIGTVVWASGDRRKETHRLLSATPYLRSRRLATVACPDRELEARCASLHDAYWIARGRPHVIQPMREQG